MSNFVHREFEEQLKFFESRDMSIKDKDKAIQTLQKVSYYKIKEFASPFSKK